MVRATDASCVFFFKLHEGVDLTRGGVTVGCLLLPTEIARWSLDLFQIPYAESRFLPMFHFVGVTWHAGFSSGKAVRG